MSDLPVRPKAFQNRIEDLGYKYLSFEVRKLAQGQEYSGETCGNESGIAVLGDVRWVKSSRGEWRRIGGPRTVFDGFPHTLYLPLKTSFVVTAETDCDFAFCYCRAEEEHSARLVTPDHVSIEIRGGGNATRQIHGMIPPSLPAPRLIVAEVFTPPGNGSSYPPHKHDVQNPPAEVDIEEIHCNRMKRPEGYAMQKVYIADRRINETLTVRDGELVLIPEGYHPVVAAHGYNVHYLNALAGSAHSLAGSDDSDHAWANGEWHELDPRLPLLKR